MNPPIELVAGMNIRKKLEMHGFWNDIVHVKITTHDRIFFQARLALRVRLAASDLQRGQPSGGPHDLVYPIFNLSALTERWSYREPKRPSLQVVVGRCDAYLYGDADIDLASPTMDIIGFFTHMAEVIMPGATNHRNLQKKIDKEYQQWIKKQNA